MQDIALFLIGIGVALIFFILEKTVKRIPHLAIIAGYFVSCLLIFGGVVLLPLPLWLRWLLIALFAAIIVGVLVLRRLLQRRKNIADEPEISIDIVKPSKLSLPKYRASHHVRGDTIDLKLEFDRGEMASDKIICVVEDPDGVKTFSDQGRGLHFFKDAVKGMMGAIMATEANFHFPNDFGVTIPLKKGEYIVTWRFMEGYPLLKKTIDIQYLGGHSDIVATDKFAI